VVVAAMLLQHWRSRQAPSWISGPRSSRPPPRGRDLPDRTGAGRGLGPEFAGAFAPRQHRQHSCWNGGDGSHRLRRDPGRVSRATSVQLQPANAPVSAQEGFWPLAALFVVIAVGNRVSNRVLLAMVARDTYFLAVATTIVQLSVYSFWLAWRNYRGLVSEQMWRFAAAQPWLLAAFGACEGAFLPLVFYSASHLPGPLVQVLNQSLIPFTCLFSAWLLGRRFGGQQLLGVTIVLVGVLLAVVTEPTSVPSAAVHSPAGRRGVYVLLCVLAYASLSMGMVVKEAVLRGFRGWEGREAGEAGAGRAATGGQSFDCSLLVTVSTASRLATLLLGWPLLLASLGRRPLAAALLQGVLEGAASMLQGPQVVVLALTYWACNIGMSVLAIYLVQMSSANATVLANVVALPLAALLFCLPLPGLPPQAFRWSLAASVLIAVAGNLVYNRGKEPPSR